MGILSLLQNFLVWSIPSIIEKAYFPPIWDSSCHKKGLSDHFKTLVDIADSSAKKDVYLPILVPVKEFVHSSKHIPVISRNKSVQANWILLFSRTNNSGTKKLWIVSVRVK